MTNEIITERVVECPACGAAGTNLYRNLSDLVFGAAGKWSLARCTCEKCRLIWLDPRPTREDMPLAYQAYYTHTGTDGNEATYSQSWLRRLYRNSRERYIRQRFRYPGSRAGLVARFLGFLQPAGPDAFAVEGMFLPARGKGARLLEIGCGDGRTLEQMRNRGWAVEGVEFDPECVRQVQARGMVCHNGDVRDLALPDNSYDAIFMGNVIEHVYEPGAFLRECLRILKPGGRIVALTPNAESWGHRHFKRDWRGLEPPRHLQIFTPTNLCALAQQAGFAECRARTTNRGAWYIFGTSARIGSARQRNLDRSRPASLPFSPAGLGYALIGRIVGHLGVNRGEEIVFRACKA
jgi:2-polyprenyl-3-methyl-5-hydroxy-6-metoxy-1,4-benzoquinol methylase